jgi:hypothetical protein
VSYYNFNVLNVSGEHVGSQSRGRQSDWDSCGSIHQEQPLIPYTSGSKLKDFTLYKGSPELQVPSAEEAEEVESPPKELPLDSVTANLDGYDVLPTRVYLDNNTPLHSVDLEGMFYCTSIFDDLTAYGLTLVHVHNF